MAYLEITPGTSAEWPRLNYPTAVSTFSQRVGKISIKVISLWIYIHFHAVYVYIFKDLYTHFLFCSTNNSVSDCCWSAFNNCFHTSCDELLFYFSLTLFKISMHSFFAYRCEESDIFLKLSSSLTLNGITLFSQADNPFRLDSSFISAEQIKILS